MLEFSSSYSFLANPSQPLYIERIDRRLRNIDMTIQSFRVETEVWATSYISDLYIQKIEYVYNSRNNVGLRKGFDFNRDKKGHKLQRLEQEQQTRTGPIRASLIRASLIRASPIQAKVIT